MRFNLVPFTPENQDSWDVFCLAADNAGILQTRKYLGYHRDRFIDASLLIYDGKKLLGLLPSAIDPCSPQVVSSHPGITYAGVVSCGHLLGQDMLDAMVDIKSYYKEGGLRQWLYKPVPHPYAQRPSQDDLYALFRLNANRVRVDLACTIDLHSNRGLSQRRRRNLKKSIQKVTVEVCQNTECWKSIWSVLEENLTRKHDANPVHSFEEIEYLRAQFPESITAWIGLIDGQCESGVVVFKGKNIWKAQYIASSAIGYESQALDSVFDAIMAKALLEKIQYFDFGTSNRDQGKTLNEGLYQFKSEFGGAGIVYEQYLIDL